MATSNTPLTLAELQRQVDQWITTVGVRYFDPMTNMAILAEEVGEVARLMARLHGEQSFKAAERDRDHQADLADEMADVLWVLMALANQTGVDLEAAFRRNLDKKTRRDADRHAENSKLS
jgi:NTP pyrophosphatase (non-canonical NTP hydrolase)